MSIKPKQIMYYIITILIILCGTVEWKYIVEYNFPSTLIKYLLVISLVLCIAMELFRAKFFKSYFVYIGAILLCAAIYIAFTRYNIEAFAENFVLFIVLFFILAGLMIQNKTYMSFLQAFENVILVIGLITLFFWFFGSVLQVLPGRRQISYQWANGFRKGFTYYNLYFENVRENQKLFGLTISRNCGIYTEVPAFAEMVLMGLLIDVFAIKNKRKVKRILLIVIMLSTQSTKSLVILIILFLARYVFGRKKRNQYEQAVKFIVGCAMIFVAYFLLSYILRDKSETRSFLVRSADLYSCGVTFLKHPIFGVGYNNNYEVIKNSPITKYNNGLSMGAAVLLAEGGIYLTACYILPFIKSYKAIFAAHRKDYLFACLAIGMNLFISNSWMSLSYLFMMGSCLALLANRSSEKHKKKRLIIRKNQE